MSWISEMYADLYKNDLKTKDQIPEKYREEVMLIVSEEEEIESNKTT